ncbi:MAG: GNAT family N-acetyltransferase [Turicibacter sp.]|nr:GNAT family N-acetyltransferase [Turicibacter sp.]
MKIRQATLNEILDVTRLALVLWPDDSMPATALKIVETMCSNKGAYFLVFTDNEAVGFAQTTIKTHLNEETHPQLMGYIEGLFIKKNYRSEEVVQQLVNLGKQWAIEQGCGQFKGESFSSIQDGLVKEETAFINEMFSLHIKPVCA